MLKAATPLVCEYKLRIHDLSEFINKISVACENIARIHYLELMVRLKYLTINKLNEKDSYTLANETLALYENFDNNGVS